MAKKLVVMRKKLLVIKLGGSAITVKDAPSAKANLNVIKRLAKEIKTVLDLGKYKIILVHGAGSFAHGLVKKYNLHQGIKENKQKYALGLVVDAMLRLNSIIMDQLLRLNLKAVSVLPHTFITQTSKKLNDFDTSAIKTYLDSGQMPVLFGTIVLDKRLGYSILSGDTIACFLARKLKADKVIFLTDVDGVYDSNPNQNPKAKLIRNITNKNINSIKKNLFPTGRDDVTGEMAGKISEIQKYLTLLPVWIINGQNPMALVRLLNEDPVGTELLFH